MTSPSARIALKVLESVVRPLGNRLPANYFGVLVARAAIDGMMRGVNALERREPITPVSGDVRGEWVGEVPGPGQTILYYLHGSGFALCSPRTHRGLVSELVQRTGRPAFVLRYRRAPEHRFPAAHDDALAGFRWLLGQGFAASDIVIGGDSAGGHLTLALCAQLREQALPQPSAVFALSPLVDASFRTAAAREPSVRDPFVTARTAGRFIGLYTAGADLTDPLLDVAVTAGADLPPILIQVGGRELLAADAERYNRAARAVGARCTLHCWPDMFHVFQLGYRFLPEARAALAEVEKFVARSVAVDRQDIA